MKLTKKQSEAIDLLEDKQTTELLFGGGAGGGKSIFGCYWITKNAIQYPATRWLIGRSVLKTLKETTLNSLFDLFRIQGIARNVHYKINYQSNLITFFNGSEILLKDLFNYPSDPNFDELGSLEISGAFVDEANQITEKCKEILKSRIRYKLDENNIIPKILYTCNPAKNWTYSQFYKPWREGSINKNRAVIQSLAIDNPYISKHYLENLKTLDKVSKERLLFGNWEYDDDPARLINFDAITNIFTNNFQTKGNKYLSADVARFGDDQTVLIVWDSLKVVDYKLIRKSSIVEVVDAIKFLEVKHAIPRSQVVIDEDGVGGGAVDLLSGCKGFVNNSRALNGENYQNLKSQCYFKLADFINSNQIGWPDCDTITKEKLIEELEQVKRNNIDKDQRLSIIPKDKVKELIGRSPDISDALALRMFFELSPPPRVRSRNY